MSQKNLNASNKIRRILVNKLKNKKIFQIYKKFEEALNLNDNFIVAVSGGPDSLALTYLAKIYSIKKSLNVRFYLIDHKLRKGSSIEAKLVKKKLEEHSIKLDILKWNGKKPKTNIQSVARNKRYDLLINKAKNHNIKNILLGHHIDDLFENFFMRMLRGSGLNGLISLDQKSKTQKINLLRPLLKLDKKDLIYLSNYIFGSYIDDPSNEDDKFKRSKIRKFLNQLKLEGLDKNKFFLTIKNLKSSNEAIKFYTKKNLSDNVYFSKKKFAIINNSFFENSDEIIFRSFSEVIKLVGKKYYSVRGKKIEKIIKSINNQSSLKVTLGGCLIRKVNQTVIISKEQ